MSRTGIYDIHCHIVPGVDDGASDYEDTKKLLRMEYDCHPSFQISYV